MVPLHEGRHQSGWGKQQAGKRAPEFRGGDKIQFSSLPSHCFLLRTKGWPPTPCTQNGVRRQPRLACKSCSSHQFLKLVQFGKSFFPCSVVFCQRHLLWGPAEHMALLVLSIGVADAQGQKGTQNPSAIYDCACSKPKRCSECTLGALLSPLGRKNMN